MPLSYRQTQRLILLGSTRDGEERSEGPMQGKRGLLRQYVNMKHNDALRHW